MSTNIEVYILISGNENKKSFNFSNLKLNYIHDADSWNILTAKSAQDKRCVEGDSLVFSFESLNNERLCEASSLYIPGDFCRQADLLKAAQNTNRPLLVERGAFLAPSDLKNLWSRLSSSAGLAIVEAGTAFGQGERIFDIKSFSILKQLGVRFGVNLTSIIESGARYPYSPGWLKDYRFLEDVIAASKCLGASFFVLDATLGVEKAVTYLEYLEKSL